MEQIFLSICLTLIGCCLIFAVKNQATYLAHGKIIDAVFDYKMWCLDHCDFQAHKQVEFDDLESYNTTLFRIWDWGYTRILPPEKFELIKPFIK